MQDNAAAGSQQQGAEDVLPKRHTKSQNKVKLRLTSSVLPSYHAISAVPYVYKLHCCGCVARNQHAY